MKEMENDKSRFLTLSLAALGVVFGDIGTSPLYAFRQSLLHLSLTPDNIYGVISLIFWSLILVISFKYIAIIIQADNEGEGGIMALSSLLKEKSLSQTPWLLFLTIVGIGLIIGDGILTPAISVLSAVEGLEAVSTHFSLAVLPATVIILVVLFWLQRIGTEKIGIYFGPIILVWFTIIGILGLLQIIQNPIILKAINPYYAIHFFILEKWMGIIALGGVFLVVTGGEALYADIGHFGKKSIRVTWFLIVLPGLLLNYFGQGAYVLHHFSARSNPFYSLAPPWFLPILIGLATAATIIASQAIIAAVFSILKQAILLNIIPRFKIIQTSAFEKGQVYLPMINFFLGIGACSLVLIFRTSTSLASAYGIAVNLYMIITTILVARIAYLVWHWNFLKLFLFAFFLLFDSLYLVGNFTKFAQGGWIPLCIAFFGMITMYTWCKGFEQLRRVNFHENLSDRSVIEELNDRKVRRLPGSALFLTDPYDELGGSLLHHLSINRILPKTIIFVTIHIENKPYIPIADKFEIIREAEGFYVLQIFCGFAETIHLPKILETMVESITLPFELDLKYLVYFVEIIAIHNLTRSKRLWKWQKYLFSFMLRNAVPDLQFYSLPFNKTVAIGTYYRL